MYVAPTLQQSYAYADLVKFYAQLPHQYLYVLVTSSKHCAITAHATSVHTVLGRSVRRVSALATLPRWNAAVHLATVLYGRAQLPKASVSSE